MLQKYSPKWDQGKHNIVMTSEIPFYLGFIFLYVYMYTIYIHILTQIFNLNMYSEYCDNCTSEFLLSLSIFTEEIFIITFIYKIQTLKSFNI